MQVVAKSINDYTREIKVDLNWEEVQPNFNKSAKVFSKKIKMPGFRPGKVPMERLLNQFQANIEAEFMDANFQKYYLAAVQEKKLMPVNKAEIKDVNFRMNENFSFTATFEVEPELTIPNMKKNSLQVNRTNYLHDDQDIEDAILQLRKAQASIVTIEDGAKEGDYLVCTLQKLDDSGVPIIGKKFENQYLRVGKGSFTDDQKDKLIGLKSGETARLRLPVNEDGGDADYDLVVGKVERENLPELNNDFLKIVNPDLDSVDSLRKDVEKKIIENFKERSQTAYERELSDKAIDFVNPSFAPSMVANYLENLLEDVKKQNNGEPLDESKVKEQYKPVAERNVKWYSIRKELIHSQEMKVEKVDVEDEILRLIQRTPKSEKEIKRFYKKPSNKKRIEDDLMEKKILSYLEQFTQVKEVNVETKKLRENENAN
ncbi:MAG: trigger factor [Candidatus Neomarinimicrobiota bacterium]